MRAPKWIIICFILAAGLLAGCKDAKTAMVLSHIDTLINDHPDSALQMLDSLKAGKPQWARSQRMKYDLLYLKAENKAFVPISSDSIAKNLVSYYNTWGNANERLMAYYLLGCCYRDMGEAPRAVDAYLDAVAQADTTSNDCDFRTLSRVYAQMADIYHKQLLLTNEIEAYKRASNYAYLAKDTFNAIFAVDKSTAAYILLNKRDSAEILLNEVQRLYKQQGFVQDALLSSTKLMYMFVQNSNKLSEVISLMDEYEQKSKSLGSHNELSDSKRIYYYYKGQYFEKIEKLDSAEYYYRKVYHPNMPFTANNSMYKGLLSIFTKRHHPDSIAKYAKLYCEVNDSSIARKDQELTAQMAANYNYTRYQREARENEAKANKIQLFLIGLIIVLLFIALIIHAEWKKNKRKIERQKAAYAAAIDEYNQNLHTLQLLDNTHLQVIAAIQGELDKSQNENQSYKAKLEEINVQYQSTRQELTRENTILKSRIDELKRQEGIRQHLTKSKQFVDTSIVKRIFYLANHPLEKITEQEWEQFVTTATIYYPALIHDLNNTSKAAQQEIRVCLLVCLAIRESEIANLLSTSLQRITNIKSNINKSLFSDSSARSLYKNLTNRYEIYTL